MRSTLQDGITGWLNKEWAAQRDCALWRTEMLTLPIFPPIPILRYTGGDSFGNMDKLQDKKVAIIGTGATGIQCIPYLGESAGQLFVFSRTPSSVDTRGNKPTDPDWWKSLEPGWQKRRRENFSILTLGGVLDEDLVGDQWTSTVQFILSLKKQYAGRGMKASELLQLADFQKMESIRKRVDDIVKDPETADGLKPYYSGLKSGRRGREHLR